MMIPGSRRVVGTRHVAGGEQRFRCRASTASTISRLERDARMGWLTSPLILGETPVEFAAAPSNRNGPAGVPAGPFRDDAPRSGIAVRRLDTRVRDELQDLSYACPPVTS